MKLHTWLSKHLVPYLDLPNGGYQVFCTSRLRRSAALFRLDDYLVSSAASGPSYILIPRESGPAQADNAPTERTD